MKKMLSALLIAVCFFACGETEELSDPNLVAEKFLKEYIHMNYTAAQKYATAEFKGIIDQYDAEKSLLAADVIKQAQDAIVEIKNMDIKDAEGVAYVKFSNSQIPDIVDQLELKKIGNKWYAHNVERTVDVELNNKFPDEEIERMMQEAEDQEETIPTEAVE